MLTLNAIQCNTLFQTSAAASSTEIAAEHRYCSEAIQKDEVLCLIFGRVQNLHDSCLAMVSSKSRADS